MTGKPPMVNRIRRIDAIEGLRRLPDASVDLIVTDPPYNIAAKNRSTIQRGNIVSTMQAWGAWDHMGEGVPPCLEARRAHGRLRFHENAAPSRRRC